jgi:class 3 adenylate cyclase
MTTSSLRAGMGLAVVSLLWVAACSAAFSSGLVLPLLQPLASGATSLALLLGYRFSIADRDKHRLRRAVSLYLPASEVNRMIARGETPALGGETREVTVWFSDIAGFTQLSEGMEATRLVKVLNAYFSEMTAIIESHGGIVDKFMGDGIIAVFGAPLADAEHARHAIGAALACAARLDHLNRSRALPGGCELHARFGINTGKAVVGNIGSAARFNYTVVGDAVNVAARLEGANKAYGTRILISEATAEAAGHAVICREIDLVRVVGRAEPVRVFEPLTDADGADGQRARHGFAEALADFRAGRFAEAGRRFRQLAPGDPVAARFCDRAVALAEAGGSGAWDAVNDLTEK